MAYDATPFPMPGTRFILNADPPDLRHGWQAAISAMVVFLTVALGSQADAADTMRCPLADGFDFPVGKPEATNYYKSRGFYPNGHLGEDWNGKGGGDSDMGDPIYSIGNGVVVHSDNVGVGWGNVVIIRHAFRDPSGKIDMVDSLYGHLLERKVKLNQIVTRGQLVGTMGSNNGMYPAHLHLEVRKNLQIGMNRTQFARDYSNYYSPTQFISAHRQLPSSLQKFEMPIHTFAAYGKALSELDSSSTTSRGINIPVFQGIPQTSGPALVLTPKGGKAATPTADVPPPEKKTSSKQSKASTVPVPKPSVPQPKPAAQPPSAQPQEDFWTRMKAKLKQGKLVDDPNLRTNR